MRESAQEESSTGFIESSYDGRLVIVASKGGRKDHEGYVRGQRKLCRCYELEHGQDLATKNTHQPRLIPRLERCSLRWRVEAENGKCCAAE